MQHAPADPNGSPEPSFAVLTSGGLDSAILLADCLHRHATVHPLYIRSGLIWEPAEIEHLHRFLKRLACPALAPLAVLEMPVSDLYGNHWGLTGQNIPDDESPDEAVFLPGRNVLLLAKAILWCHLKQVPRLALAVLKSNPFPDATEHFFTVFPRIVNEGIAGQVIVERPFARRSKADILRQRKDLPLELTFSCIDPVGEKHCGRCNKCAERRRAFAEASLIDRTLYDTESPCTA